MKIAIILAAALSANPVHAAESAFLPIASVTPGSVATITSCAAHRDAGDLVGSDDLFTAYNVPANRRQFYRIEMLIPTTLGGTHDPGNLWPHLTVGPWNHEDKMRLDAKLTKLVCSHKLSLATAQQALRDDWTSAYEKYVGPYWPHH